MYRVITISREFGSGGRTIGREVARQLGIKCYDSELIEKIAEESGLARDYIADKGEYAAHSNWFANACGRCSGKSSSTLRKRKAALLWADAPTTYFKTETTV